MPSNEPPSVMSLAEMPGANVASWALIVTSADSLSLATLDSVVSIC